MYLTTLSFQSGSYTLCQGSQKKAAYSTRGRILYTVCPFFYHSYVGTGKPTKTFCATVHAPMTSLKVSIKNLISWTDSWLLKVFYAISVLRALSMTRWMFVVKQVPVCFLTFLILFDYVVLRKLYVHSLFMLETVVFPECLLFLNQ